VGLPGDIACQELVELVTDYLEDSLSPAERAHFEQHLLLCDGCAVYLEQMRETIRLAGKLKEEDVAPEARDALLEVFRRWKKGPGGSGGA
jgi:anti-sigma factor RsiW